jgi:acyl-CoA oxidase
MKRHTSTNLDSYLSKPTVEGDNWMITQQVASYLIKKMEGIAKDPTQSPKDRVDEIFKTHLVKKRLNTNILRSGNIDVDAVVKVFEWRVAYQVRHNPNVLNGP